MALPERHIINATSAFDLYLQAVELTESPLIFHRWCFISAISTLLGRNVWFPFGDRIIYPNQYIVLVGPPGSRKSAAIDVVGKLVGDAGYEHFAPDRSSKEKFMLDWEFGFDKIARGEEPGSPGESRKGKDVVGDELFGSLRGMDKLKISEAYIKSGELQDFLGGGNADFIVTLTNLWDCLPKYTDRFKNSASLYIPNPTINLLGGCTPTTFSSVFSSNTVGQGMLSRLILVHGGGQRMKLTIPPPMDPVRRATLIEYLMEVRKSSYGPLSLSELAYEAIDEIYKSWGELPDSRLLTYGSRRQTHFLKLLTVITCSELRTEISVADVILANTILTYTETYMPKALGEFGKSKNSPVSQIVLEVIQQAESMGGITGKEIFKSVNQDVEGLNELMNIIIKLGNAGKIKSVDTGEGVIFLPIRKKITTASKYINLDLLWEYKLKEAEGG